MTQNINAQGASCVTPWKILLPVLFFCAAFNFAPAKADAATETQRFLCANSIYDSDLDVFTNPPSLSIEGRLSAKDFNGSMRAWMADVRSFKRECVVGDPNYLYGAAMLQTWSAWLKHFGGKDSVDATEYAIQLLTACASEYFATPQGAHCSTWQEKVIRWKMQWAKNT